MTSDDYDLTNKDERSLFENIKARKSWERSCIIQHCQFGCDKCEFYVEDEVFKTMIKDGFLETYEEYVLCPKCRNPLTDVRNGKSPYA